MTNEEIEQKAQQVYDYIGSDFGHQIAQAMRELVSQAYEEAAQVADEHRQWSIAQKNKTTLPLEEYFDGYEVGCKNTAYAIRALRDSLVVETISSHSG